jgi:uncharacterized protein (DUF58 family)
MAQKGFEEYRQRRLQFFSTLKLMNIFPGEWESIYTGSGIEFADSRPYEPGDDLGDLDLAALVQTGEEIMVQRAVARRMNIYVLVDMSGSMRRSADMFFPFKPDIRDIAAGLVVFSSNKVYSPVGLGIITENVDSFIPAGSGEQHNTAVLERIISYDFCDSGSSNIQEALSLLIRRIPSQSMVFLISDFYNGVFEEDFTHLLRPLVKRCDFIPVVIQEAFPEDVPLKKAVNISVRDNETKGRSDFCLTPELIDEMRTISMEHLVHLKNNFNRMGIDQVVLNSPSPDRCCQDFTDYFENRKRIKR